MYASFAYAWLVPVIAILSNVTSGMNLLLIVHKFLSICFPIRSLKFDTVHMTYVQLGIMLIIAIAMDTPRFFEFRIAISNDTDLPIVQATDLWYNELYQLLYKFILVILIKKLLPMIVMAVLTAKIVIALRKARKHSREMSRSSTKGIRRSSDRMTRVIIVVSVTFILLQLPSAIYPIMREFTEPTMYDDSCGIYEYFSNTADFLALSNSAINFWLYFIVSLEFRKKLYRALRS